MPPKHVLVGTGDPVLWVPVGTVVTMVFVGTVVTRDPVLSFPKFPTPAFVRVSPVHPPAKTSRTIIVVTRTGIAYLTVSQASDWGAGGLILRFYHFNAEKHSSGIKSHVF